MQCLWCRCNATVPQEARVLCTSIVDSIRNRPFQIILLRKSKIQRKNKKCGGGFCTLLSKITPPPTRKIIKIVKIRNKKFGNVCIYDISANLVIYMTIPLQEARRSQCSTTVQYPIWWARRTSLTPNR